MQINEKALTTTETEYRKKVSAIEDTMETVNAPFEADEESPYAFVSYAHKSRNRVFESIKRVYEKGWRLWYDEGLEIGGNYYSSLKKHIRECEVFLLYLTQESYDSTFVREHEIPYAVELGKPIVVCIMDKNLSIDIDSKNVYLTDDEHLESMLNNIKDFTRTETRVAKGHVVKINIPEADGEFDYEFCQGGVRLGHYNGNQTEVFIPEEYPPFSGYKVVELGSVFDKKITTKKVHVPSTVKTMDWETFCFARSIEDIYVPSSVIEVPNFGIVSRRIHCAENSAAYEYVLKYNQDKWDNNRPAMYEWIQAGTPMGAELTGLVLVIDESMDIITEEEVKPKTNVLNTAFCSYYLLSKEKYNELLTSLERKHCHLTVCDSADFEIRKKSIAEAVALVALVDRDYVKDVVVDDIRYAASLGKSIAVYVLEECELPVDINGMLMDIHQLRYNTGTSEERKVKLINWLTDNGCRDAKEIDEYKYRVAEEGLVLEEYNGEDFDVVVEEEFGGMKVVSVGKAFAHNSRLRSIVLPDSLTVIDDGAFINTTSLRELVVPDNVKEICQTAFSGSSIERLVVGEGTRKIMREVLLGCNELKELILPDGLEYVGEDGFGGMEASLPTTEYNDAVYLGSRNNPYLILLKAVSKEIKSCSIHKDAKIIFHQAFSDCSKLTSIDVPEGMKQIGVEAFRGCKCLHELTIPNSVEYIGRNVFAIGYNGKCATRVRCGVNTKAQEYCYKNGVEVKLTGTMGVLGSIFKTAMK